MRSIRMTITVFYDLGQMCIVKGLPSAPGEAITLCFAPPGVRQIPRAMTIDQLLNEWPAVHLRPQYSPIHHIKQAVVGRRWQYPLKLFVASTIHKTMGDTVSMLSTQIVENESHSISRQPKAEYELWMRAQLYVLISRVRSLECVTFVGNKDTTLRNVRRTLELKSQWTSLIYELINGFSGNPAPTVYHGNKSPFPPFFSEVPDTNHPFVYLLLSSKQGGLWYIGSTSKLRRRLREHNSGHGSNFTKPISRRPWYLMAYLFGFSNISQAQNFELDWQDRMNQCRQRAFSMRDAILMAELLVQNYSSSNFTVIKMIVCGIV